MSCISSVWSESPKLDVSQGKPAPVIFINDQNLIKNIENTIGELYSIHKNITTHSQLIEQSSREICRLSLPPHGKYKLTPAEIYGSRLGSVVMVGVFYHCSSKSCKKTHFRPASGVVIAEGGIIVTNYHVLKSKAPNKLGMAAATHDGRAFLVEEVLAASEKDDIAILKLKNGGKLTPIPIFKDEPIGSPITLITHPSRNYFYLSKGYIARYYIEDDEKEMMSVTADFAKGSSGGPLFNDRGDIVGLVQKTRSIEYNPIPLSTESGTGALKIRGKGDKPLERGGRKIRLGQNHQMTFKITVPSRSILKLIAQEHF